MAPFYFLVFSVTSGYVFTSEDSELRARDEREHVIFVLPHQYSLMEGLAEQRLMWCRRGCVDTQAARVSPVGSERKNAACAGAAELGSVWDVVTGYIWRVPEGSCSSFYFFPFIDSCGFYVMKSNPTSLPVSLYLPSAFATSPNQNQVKKQTKQKKEETCSVDLWVTQVCL